MDPCRRAGDPPLIEGVVQERLDIVSAIRRGDPGLLAQSWRIPSTSAWTAPSIRSLTSRPGASDHRHATSQRRCSGDVVLKGHETIVSCGHHMPTGVLKRRRFERCPRWVHV